MTLEQWVTATGVTAAGVLGWFVRLERRLSNGLTRREHDEICERRNQEISATLQVIRDDIRELRGELRDSLRRDR